MRHFIFLLLTVFSLTLSAQTFNTPFIEVVELSKDDTLRNRISVAMYIRAGEALVDTTLKAANTSYYEKLFASQIVTDATNNYFVSLFTNAALTVGVKKETPDAFLYAAISQLWPNIVKAWMYKNGYIPLVTANPTEPTTPE
jgi:hypothetical protein